MKIFSNLFKQTIATKDELKQVLRSANKNKLINSDALNIMESTLRVEELTASDIMLPRNQIDTIDTNDSVDVIIKKIIKTGHSRFPVIDGNISNIVGIFHSKDLVHYIDNSASFQVRDYIRQLYFVPDIKPLDSILYEMRQKHNHLAIVVDEYTNIVGLLTLEMIIEQIIGEIDDEYDSIEGDRLIVELAKDKYRIKGGTKLFDINNRFGFQLEDNLVETISGYIVKKIGRIPNNGEILTIDGLSFEIISADTKKINLLILHKN
jgi:magnesium and cobalt transporter